MNRNKPVRHLWMALIATVVFSFSAISQAQDVELESLSSKFSYVLGVQFGYQILQQLQSASPDLDRDAVALGIADIFADGELKMTSEQMETAADEFQKRMEEQQMAMAEMQITLGNEFREQYAKQDGVQSTDSGLLYKVIEEGSGDKPTGQSTVEVHYKGALIDGQEFDSSYSRGEPTTFGIGGIIPGWGEILQMMPTGSKWEVVIPPELAYGESGAPPAIPPHSTLVFEIELLSFE